MSDKDYITMQERILNYIKSGDNRKKIIESPNKVFKEEFGIALPNDVEIKIIENGSNTYNFVIPSSNDNPNGVW